MYAGFLVGLGCRRSCCRSSPTCSAGSPEPLAALVTCTLMVGLGVIDDRRGTSALAKFTAQVFIAGVLVLMACSSLTYFWIPGTAAGRQPDLGSVGPAHDPVGRGRRQRREPGRRPRRSGGGHGGHRRRRASSSTWSARRAVRRRLRGGPAVGDHRGDLRRASCRGTSTRRRSSWATPARCCSACCWRCSRSRGWAGTRSRRRGGDLAAIAGPLLVPCWSSFDPVPRRGAGGGRAARWRGQGIGHADKEHIHHRLDGDRTQPPLARSC